MSGFIRFLGAMFVFLGVAIFFFEEDGFMTFFPDEYNHYAHDLINNKWMIIICGVFLGIAGNVTKINKKLIDKRTDNKDFHSKDERENLQDTSKQKQSTNRLQQFIESQQGDMRQLAEKIEWNSLDNGSSNFKTSFLKKIDSYRLEVCLSKGGILFAGIFLVTGLIVLSAGLKPVFKTGDFEGQIFICLFGLVFSVVGAVMLYWPRPRVFDIQRGWFWVGDKSLSREQDFMRLKQSARLSEISVIQIVSTNVTDSDGDSYRSWELNIVSIDGKRLHVMGHGNESSLKSDAQLLSEFLGVPIWDVS